jgi:hypothetical protein
LVDCIRAAQQLLAQLQAAAQQVRDASKTISIDPGG